MSRTPSDYRKFYPCHNKDILSNDGGQPEGYVTKDCLLYTSDAADE